MRATLGTVLHVPWQVRMTCIGYVVAWSSGPVQSERSVDDQFVDVVSRAAMPGGRWLLIRKWFSALFVVALVVGLMVAPADAARQRVVYAKLTWTPSKLMTNLAPGESADLMATVEVDRAVNSYSFLVRPARPGIVTVDTSGLPTTLEPGVQYEVPVTVAIPNESRRFRLNTSIVVRQGSRQLTKALPLYIGVTKARATPTPIAQA